MAVKKTKTRIKTKTTSKQKAAELKAAKMAEAEDRFISQTLEKRRRLMWLGVGLSAAIILVLWIFSWQIDYPSLTKSSQAAMDANELKSMTQELANVLADTKDSLANIENTPLDLTNQSNTSEDQAESEITKELKEKVLNKLEEEDNNEEASQSPVIIFKDNE